MSLLTEALSAAGTMGLPADGEPVPEPCWGTLGDSGSTLTRAGAGPMHTDWDKTTTRGRRAELLQLRGEDRALREAEELTRLALVHGAQPLQEEALGCCRAVAERDRGHTHGPGLDGRLAAQDGAGLQRG